MKIKYAVLVLVLFLFSTCVFAAGRTPEQLATQAVSDDVSASAPAIAELRAMGSFGLDALFVKYAADTDPLPKPANRPRVGNVLQTLSIQSQCKRTPTLRISIGTQILTKQNVLPRLKISQY